METAIIIRPLIVMNGLKERVQAAAHIAKPLIDKTIPIFREGKSCFVEFEMLLNAAKSDCRVHGWLLTMFDVGEIIQIDPQCIQFEE
jgi:hypothetical protein